MVAATCFGGSTGIAPSSAMYCASVPCVDPEESDVASYHSCRTGAAQLFAGIEGLLEKGIRHSRGGWLVHHIPSPNTMPPPQGGIVTHFTQSTCSRLSDRLVGPCLVTATTLICRPLHTPVYHHVEDTQSPRDYCEINGWG